MSIINHNQKKYLSTTSWWFRYQPPGAAAATGGGQAGGGAAGEPREGADLHPLSEQRALRAVAGWRDGNWDDDDDECGLKRIIFRRDDRQMLQFPLGLLEDDVWCVTLTHDETEVWPAWPKTAHCCEADLFDSSRLSIHRWFGWSRC